MAESLSIGKEKLPSLFIKEAFHSFELEDEFQAAYLADLAFNSLHAKKKNLCIILTYQWKSLINSWKPSKEMDNMNLSILRLM